MYIRHSKQYYWCQNNYAETINYAETNYAEIVIMNHSYEIMLKL